jgi:adenylylsulfate kinase
MAPVIWLTGISGSGKTTIGIRLQAELEKRYERIEFIDGDIVRNFFENDLGYVRSERIMNVKRIAFAAMLVAKNNTPVIVANIAPYYEVRDFIRKHIPNYIQVYLDSSQEKVVERDVKGHYARFQNFEMENMIGLDDAYDIPRCPDLVVNTDCESVQESLDDVLEMLREKGI